MARKTARKSARNPRQRRSATARPTQAAEPPAGADDRIIDAALRLAETRGWGRTTLPDIAGEAGLGLAELYGRFRSKGAIREAFIQRVDRATLDGIEPGAGDASVRDRLFDLLMRRFDALQPYKGAVAALAREAPFHPLGALCAGRRLLRSMAWIGGAAGLPTGGPFGLLRVKAVMAIYLYAMRAWLRDDSEDHGKTMAALDQALSRAEMFANSVPRRAKPAA